MLRLVALGYEQITVGTGASYLAPPRTATHALIAVESQPIRWRVGQNPTGTTGIRQVAGDVIEWLDSRISYVSMLDEIRFTRDGTATADAALDIQYFVLYNS